MNTPPKAANDASVTPLFVSEVYRADLSAIPDFETLLEDLDDTCRAFADEDEAGQNWSQQKAYLGYTSYGSLNDLPLLASVFEDLKTHLDAHAARFAEALEYDLPEGALKLDNMWINILEPMGTHSGHIHPHSLISGTFYVHVPDGASALKFEDPRLTSFMNSPPRKANARRDHQAFVYEAPQPGTLLMWESWLRHEVPINLSEDVRISISFNYSW
ncbi:TIGR02466 family protein [Asticcacaulis sp. BYS171W]|uniref:TIGR02466 family protein n=1 Tax=Asticcacaulis aquaticus TaxID=2984212 RepID=A0ABT5HWB3_9CAUL|nr:TIGR02466 family protein [Asticcacaulis aquaticus]MDC7684264.1 TIGR02466 family protein [Asticcacaulis aquaticus]